MDNFTYEDSKDKEVLPSSSVKREELKLINEEKFEEADKILKKKDEEFDKEEELRKKSRKKEKKFGLF